MGQLAYDENPKLGYTVYIEESGTLTPYLVLTNDYNDSGNTLLLRTYIMDEMHRYNSMFRGAAYYNGCELDVWLNDEFLDTIGGVDIVDSTINISAKEALGHCGDETEDITRKAFLLSWGEVGARANSTIPDSGERLDYFSDPKRRIACLANGNLCAWDLRSVATCNDSRNAGVSMTGSVGGGGVDHENGTRPAFCVDSGTEVVLLEDAELGEIFITTK